MFFASQNCSRGHERRRAEAVAGAGQVEVIEQVLHESEIGELRHALGRHQDVVGFHVAMDTRHGRGRIPARRRPE